MAYPMGEAKLEPLRVDFDRRLKLEFHGSDISSILIAGAGILFEPQRHRDTEEVKGRFSVLGASRRLLPFSVKDLCASVSLWSSESEGPR